MYHDQVNSNEGYSSYYSVYTTIGLPFIRTSPDHGTAFGIAGKGIAQSQSMLEAIKTAIKSLQIQDCLILKLDQIQLAYHFQQNFYYFSVKFGFYFIH